MDYLFCGIDISKDLLDFALCSGEQKEVIDNGQVSNDRSGIEKLFNTLLGLRARKEIWVCFEHTGHYGALLAHLLHEHDLRFSSVPSLEIIKSSGMTRGKTDPVDAARIATYAATFQHKLKPTVMQKEEITLIKHLLTIRDQAVRVRTQFKNALKSLEISGEVVDLKAEIKGLKAEIKRQDKRVAEVEKKIRSTIASSIKLKETYDKISQVTGIGLITACALITSTNCFEAFNDPRKFNCYCGLAPFEHSSGSSVKKKTRTSRYRNREMKKLMFTAANAAIAYDEQLKNYYNRKVREGKPKMSVINAVACKLVSRVFAVANREEPYVKLVMA